MSEKTYKCLNPVGIQDPVEQLPISPRLDKIDGKNIFFSIVAGGEQDIIIPLTKRLQSDYPQVNWEFRSSDPGRGVIDAISQSQEEEKQTEADAMIRGVVW